MMTKYSFLMTSVLVGIIIWIVMTMNTVTTQLNELRNRFEETSTTSKSENTSPSNAIGGVNIVNNLLESLRPTFNAQPDIPDGVVECDDAEDESDDDGTDDSRSEQSEEDDDESEDAIQEIHDALQNDDDEAPPPN